MHPVTVAPITIWVSFWQTRQHSSNMYVASGQCGHCKQQGRRAWSLSLRRSVAFQWFLTAFSVRPEMTLAMSAHLHINRT